MINKFSETKKGKRIDKERVEEKVHENLMGLLVLAFVTVRIILEDSSSF